jgi:glycosyltransferase involved in cell wall biosynthesis
VAREHPVADQQSVVTRGPRIAVDARPAVGHRKTGIGYYAWHLLRLLPVVDPSSTYIAWYLNPYAVLGARRFFEARPNFRERRTPIPGKWFEGSAASFAPRVEWLVRFDVFFATNFLPPPTRTRRLVITVHDMAFRLFPETAPHVTRQWLKRLDEVVPRATRIIAVSEATKRDLLELSDVPPERVVVIPHGIDTDLVRPASPDAIDRTRRRFGIDGPYLLYLGGIEPRKNLPRLLAAFAGLDADVRPTLVLAGGWVAWNPEGIDATKEAIAKLPEQVRQRVVMTGYVSDQDKVALLSGATALVYPSMYEGFGLPVLEAMACRIPVLTSDVGALPDVAGDAALLVPPTDVEAIAVGMDRLLRDGSLRDRLVHAGAARVGAFRWEDAARRTSEVLRDAARA